MRIGLVLDDSLDSTDGVQQYTLTVGEWLKSRGYEVYYLTGRSDRKDVENLISVSRNIAVKFNGNRLSMPLPVKKAKIRALLESLRLDVLHVQTPYSPFLAGRLIRLASPSTAVVGTFHILPYGRMARMSSGILGKINTKTAKRFDAMMAVSEPARNFAGRYFGFTSAIVSNPFHHDQFSVARRGKPIHSKVKKIVYLGRLVSRKGPVELVSAVETIEREKLTTVPYEVVIAGRGQLQRKLQSMTISAGIADKVTFPGFIAEKDKAKLLASGDILVFPSTAGESFGISLLEGMAASRGVVLAGDNPGYRSVVADPSQLLNPRDTAQFARTLSYWLNNEEERNEMAKRQQKHVKQFDIDIIGPEIEKLYTHALQKRRQS